MTRSWLKSMTWSCTEALDILVEATSALDALLKVYPELATDQTVQMVSGMLSSFPGVYAKATFSQM
mgnify:CR=1 FL=1